MGFVYIDPIFQSIFESYSIILSGILALYAPHYREIIQPNYAFRIVSKVSEDSWIVIQETFDLLDKKFGSWSSAATAPCSILLGSAYETLKSDKRYNRIAPHPTVQFLRHLRNAAFHGNRFNIKGSEVDSNTNELKKQARWRSLEITPALQGTQPFFDLIEIGDTLKLLSDLSVLLKTDK